MKLAVIAAVARNGVIGHQGRIPWHLGADLQRFKRLTMGHALIMGRRTFLSIGRPLPGRRTVVLTRSADWVPPAGVEVAHSLGDALARCRAVDESVAFVIGGAALYREALPLADELRLTEVHAEPIGDTLFPAYERAAWRETSRENHDGFAFVDYERQPRGATP